MGYDEKRGTNSSSAAVAAVLVVVLLVVLGMMVLGGTAVFFARARASEARAMEARQLALVQQERALAVAAEVRAERDAQMEVTRRMVTIQLDHEGNIEADGDSLQLAELKAKLEENSKETEIAVVISVDDRCLFLHVGAVLAVCRQTGIQNVEVGSLSDANGTGGVPATDNNE